MRIHEGDRALYLFYVARRDGVPSLEEAGIESAPVEAHGCGDLAAVVCAVSRNEFCGPDAERKLNDVQWVTERAVSHQKVIEEGFRAGPVLPARFGTLFSSFDRVARFVDANRRPIVGYLDGVRGQEEWGLKVFLHRDTATRWLGRRQSGAESEPVSSPGLAYLQRRRAAGNAERDLQRWLAESCDELARSLDGFVSLRRERDIVPSAAAEDSGELVLNLAALVPREHAEEWTKHVEEMDSGHEGRGLSLRLSGPWPPYSFCPDLVNPS